jgi:hypothetical protein
MPHYVNIALGCFYLACLFVRRSGRLFGFLLLPLKTIQLKEKRQCAAVGWHKKHDRKNNRRAGVRKGKKDRENFAKYHFNHLKIYFAKWLDFLPCGAGGSFILPGLMDGVFLICFAGCPGCLAGIALYCLHIYARPCIVPAVNCSF